jgi:hypothetical protein
MQIQEGGVTILSENSGRREQKEVARSLVFMRQTKDRLAQATHECRRRG